MTKPQQRRRYYERQSDTMPDLATPEDDCVIQKSDLSDIPSHESSLLHQIPNKDKKKE
jgi:hypothetical protein